MTFEFTEAAAKFGIDLKRWKDDDKMKLIESVAQRIQFAKPDLSLASIMINLVKCIQNGKFKLYFDRRRGYVLTDEKGKELK